MISVPKRKTSRTNDPDTSTAGAEPARAVDGVSWTSDFRRMWEGADYPAVAEHLLAAAHEVGQAAGPGGGRALDLASGTGSVALLLAEAGWQVTAVDLAPRLMSVGQRRAAERGLSIEWMEASMVGVPLDDATTDLVTSGFGLIFAPDPEEALTEVHRLLRPGGLLVFSAWTPTGTMGRMTGRIGAFLGHPEAAMAPFRWGDPSVAGRWLHRRFTDVQHCAHSLTWTFASPDEATRWFFDRSPGHRSALEAAGDAGPALVETVRTWMAELGGDDGPFDLSPDYLVTTARRR